MADYTNSEIRKVANLGSTYDVTTFSQTSITTPVSIAFHTASGVSYVATENFNYIMTMDAAGVVSRLDCGMMKTSSGIDVDQATVNLYVAVPNNFPVVRLDSSDAWQ